MPNHTKSPAQTLWAKDDEVHLCSPLDNFGAFESFGLCSSLRLAAVLVHADERIRIFLLVEIAQGVVDTPVNGLCHSV